MVMSSTHFIARNIFNILGRNLSTISRSPAQSTRCIATSTGWNQQNEGAAPSQTETELPKQNEEGPSEQEKQIEELKAQVADYKDKYVRALADRANDKVRTQKEIKDSKLFGIQSFSKDLLKITDAFEKALVTVDKKGVAASAEEKFQILHKGLTMTESILITEFERHGLRKVAVEVGDKFDTKYHQAMLQVPVTEDSQTPETVAAVLQGGWKLQDRCVRPALVKVFQE